MIFVCNILHLLKNSQSRFTGISCVSGQLKRKQIQYKKSFRLRMTKIITWFFQDLFKTINVARNDQTVFEWLCSRINLSHNPHPRRRRFVKLRSVGLILWAPMRTKSWRSIIKFNFYIFFFYVITTEVNTANFDFDQFPLICRLLSLATGHKQKHSRLFYG